MFCSLRSIDVHVEQEINHVFVMDKSKKEDKLGREEQFWIWTCLTIQREASEVC